MNRALQNIEVEIEVRAFDAGQAITKAKSYTRIKAINRAFADEHL